MSRTCSRYDASLRPSSALTSVNPVWAALAGWLFLSQSLDGIEGAGIALIAVSNVVISVRRR